jgi:hypothetical protein
LLAFRITDSSVCGRDFLRDRSKGRAPFGDRPRLTLVTYSRRRRLGKALGEFATRGGCGNRTPDIGALVLERFDALVEIGQIDRRRGTGRPGVNRANGQLCARVTLYPQRGCIQR